MLEQNIPSVTCGFVRGTTINMKFPQLRELVVNIFVKVAVTPTLLTRITPFV